jgi:hypothetical protein
VKFSFIVSCVFMLTFGEIASAQALRHECMRVDGRNSLCLFLSSRGDDSCAIEIRDRTGSLFQEIDQGLNCVLLKDRGFAIADMNFDGFLDFGLVSDCGNRNCALDWFLYNPVSGQFEASPALSEIGYAQLQLDHKRRTLTFTSVGGGARSETDDTYRWKKGELVLIRSELVLATYPDPEANLCVITRIVSELKGAEMVEVGRTCKVNGERCSCDGAVSGF